MSVIPELGRQRKEDQEFKASLGYLLRLFQKTTYTQKKSCEYIKFL
jgi:hypothetical protein